MTKDKALKLALEALEEANAEMEYLNDPKRFVSIRQERIMEKCRAAITAIREALAQPEQEPVAWTDLLREARDNCKASIVEEGISASRKEYRIDLEARLTAALNTTPPKEQQSCDRREWVGLTEQDFSAVNQSCLTKLQAATIAESILKDKNT